MFALAKQIAVSVLALAVLALSVTVLGGPAPAHADVALDCPPLNDDITAAIPIGGLPFDDDRDTSCGSSAPDDPDCLGNGPTVWYTFTPASDAFVSFDTFGSDYDTTLSAYVGSPGSLFQIACNDDSVGLQSRVRFFVYEGLPVYVMAGAFASGPGGTLHLHAAEALPPTIDIAIGPKGTVDKRGLVTISGTVTCSEPLFVIISGQVVQRVGRFNIVGDYFTFVFCDGETAWQATAQSPGGRFAGGKARVDAFAQDVAGAAFDFASATIQLTGARSSPPGPSPSPI